MTNPYLQELRDASRICSEVVDLLEIAENDVMSSFFTGKLVGLQQAIEIIEALPDPRAEGWDAARTELRGIPRWYDPELDRGGFDLADDGSEDGAYMAVKEILDNNPYRKDTK